MSRIYLTSATTIFIAPPTGAVPPGWGNGSDSNNGLSDAYPFATRQRAWNYARDNLDLAGHVLTFQSCVGTYTDDFTAVGPLVGGGESTIFFVGSYAAPNSVVINAPTVCWGAAEGARFTVLGFKGVSGGNVINAQTGGRITFGLFEFGLTNSAHLWVGFGGAITGDGSQYTISGGAAYHVKLDAWGQILLNPCTVWMPNACAFTDFVCAGTGYACLKGLTFAGPGAGTGSTGTRYVVNEGAIVLTGGAGAGYFPGGYAGSVDASTYSVYL